MAQSFVDQLFKDGLIRSAENESELIACSLLLREAQEAAAGAEHPTKVGAAALNKKNQLIFKSHNRIAEGLVLTPEAYQRRYWPDRDIHGEIYGLMNCARRGPAVEGADVAVSAPCCEACAWALIISGAKKVVYALASIDHRSEWQHGGTVNGAYLDMQEEISVRNALELFRNQGISVVAVKTFDLAHPLVNTARSPEDTKNMIDRIAPSLRRKDLRPPERKKCNRAGDPAWIDYEVIQALLYQARTGGCTDQAGIVVARPVECRQANALIVAGIRHVIIARALTDARPDLVSTRHERRVAESLMREADIEIDFAEDLNARLLCDRYLIPQQNKIVSAVELPLHILPPPRPGALRRDTAPQF